MWPEEGSWVRVELRREVYIPRQQSLSNQSSSHVEGCVFAVDSERGLAILMTPILPPDYYNLPVPLRPAVQHTVHTLCLASVKSVNKVDTPAELRQTDMLPSVRPIKMERLVRREQRALQKRQSHFGSRAPPGTSEAAMTVFAALAKTLPCYWLREESPDAPPTIVVLEEVHVTSPYTSRSCRGTIKSNPALVERVRKVLECERKRLGLQE